MFTVYTMKNYYLTCIQTVSHCEAASFKESLFKLVMQWRVAVDDRMSKFQFTNSGSVKSTIGGWLAKVRLHNTELVPTGLTGRYLTIVT